MAKKSKTNILKGPLKLVALFVFAFFLAVIVVSVFFEREDSGDYTEEFPDSGAEIVKPDVVVTTTTAATTTVMPRLAIVLDDFGQDIKKLRALEDIGVPVNIAILPFLTYSEKIAEEASLLGWDVLLHMPMEPKNVADNNPGPGVLLTSMTDEEILKNSKEALDSLPFIMGVNNHMGSHFTEDIDAMKVFLNEIKGRGLVFLDSKTSAESKAAEAAGEAGVPILTRNIFLDNEQDEEYISGQLKKATDIAIKNGYAIAIGHPHKETIAVLKRELSKYESEGILIVKLSDLYGDDSLF